MPDNTSLLRQLANRAKSFHKVTGVSQAQLASAIGMDDGNYCNFLNGRKGIGAKATSLLLKYTGMPTRQAIATFKGPVSTSRIMELQEQGRHLQLDNSGWYPSEDGSGGVDPNQAGNGIDNTPSADTEGGPVWDEALIDVLRETRGYHRKAVRAINNYIDQAKVNAGIVTPTGVSQKFATGAIARFNAVPDDVRDSASVKDLITVIAGLPDSVRRQVVALINDKFPNSR